MEKKFLPDLHVKGWGSELWIMNSDLYCGKILLMHSGKKCSWHYHLLKDEVFYVQSGKVELLVSEQDEIEKADLIILNRGDSFHVLPTIRHQMKALEDTELFEISTQHFEDDTYRVIRGD
jgi:quercetin dioxygenase-like cupin family protein